MLPNIFQNSNNLSLNTCDYELFFSLSTLMPDSMKQQKFTDIVSLISEVRSV